MLERLQKILSARGISSRRKAEEYIIAGLVKVNGKVAELGQKADPEIDKIEVDGKVLKDREEMLYYLMNKPVGVETSNVDHKDLKVQTVRHLLPKDLQGKIYPVGRLDKDSCGLILFTNDGALAFRLTHPKFDHEKEYEVKVGNPITDGALKKLEKGMMISGEKTKPTQVKRLGPSSFTICLTEGKNRQIRRMCQKVGCPVDSLKRIRIMTLTDSKLKEGSIRLLTDQEKKDLLKSVGL